MTYGPNIMTDAEIDKAISEFESVGNHQYGWDALFRDPKTRKFWELVYPQGGGPRVLQPITAYDARLRYSAAFSRKISEVHDYWLDGETLCSVTFVADYWQLHFGNSTITPLTRVEVRANGTVARDGDDQFRNRLCEQMGKVVERFELERQVACTITFEDQSSVSISLKQSDYRGPEAITISGAGHFLTVIGADD
jgi:hypothetical protein